MTTPIISKHNSSKNVIPMGQVDIFELLPTLNTKRLACPPYLLKCLTPLFFPFHIRVGLGPPIKVNVNHNEKGCPLVSALCICIAVSF